MCALAKKKAMYLIDLTVEVYEEYLRALFFGGWVVFLRSMMETRSIAAEGGADQNRMSVDVTGWVIKIFSLQTSQMNDP